MTQLFAFGNPSQTPAARHSPRALRTLIAELTLGPNDDHFRVSLCNDSTPKVDFVIEDGYDIWHWLSKQNPIPRSETNGVTTTIKVCDEEMSGKVLDEFAIEMLTERIDVRELIRSRVYQQVKDDNLNQLKMLPGADASEHEQLLNPKTRKTIAWEPLFEKAVQAYEEGRILILVDDHQTESLDQKIEVRQGTVVTFMRLIPLVGG